MHAVILRPTDGHRPGVGKPGDHMFALLTIFTVRRSAFDFQPGEARGESADARWENVEWGMGEIRN